MFTRNLVLPVTVALSIPVIALGIGCSTTQSTSSDTSDSRVGLTLETSSRDLLVGETATVTARSRDTFGREPTLTWTTTSGKLTTEQNGRIARVKFDQPGSSIVTAVLSIDGREVRRETVEIRVKPLS